MSQTDTQAAERRVDALLVGAIDPHVHTGPSIASRSVDHVDLARAASAVGMKAIVTKDHDYAGVTTAALIAKQFPDLSTKVFSSIVLNNVVGGLNPYAVEHTAAMGGKIVWLPTLAAENHLRWEKTFSGTHPGSTKKMRAARAVPVVEGDGSVRDDAKEILDIVARTDMALASGHLHISETWAVFEEAQRRGVKRLVLTHPEEIVDASLSDVRRIAAMGAYVEHSLAMFLDGCAFEPLESEILKAHIDAAGVGNTILCTDLGQVGALHPIEGMRRGIQLCIDLGYADDDIRRMVSTNTAAMLGLEDTVVGEAA
ncbi:MAG: DUF6282 family protein [Rhizobiaceae bacterium]|nr:DUF6282 family protein [Rhizobiaceae bacterium]